MTSTVKTKVKPKYNMWKNSAWIISFAVKYKEKKVLFTCLSLALLAVGSSLVRLYIAPTVLSAVERKAAVGELIVTVLLFAAANMLISALRAYMECNEIYGRITIRGAILHLLNTKNATTSYYCSCIMLMPSFLFSVTVFRIPSGYNPYNISYRVLQIFITQSVG